MLALPIPLLCEKRQVDSFSPSFSLSPSASLSLTCSRALTLFHSHHTKANLLHSFSTATVSLIPTFSPTFSPHLPKQYHFVSERKTWADALTYCKQNYVDLASIHDSEEQADVRQAAEKLERKKNEKEKSTKATWDKKSPNGNAHTIKMRVLMCVYKCVCVCVCV